MEGREREKSVSSEIENVKKKKLEQSEKRRKEGWIKGENGATGNGY